MLLEARKNELFERCLIPGDNATEFEAFTKRLYRFINPRNAAECILADELVATSWSLLRANKLETLPDSPVDTQALGSYKKVKKAQYNRAWEDLVFVRNRM